MDAIIRWFFYVGGFLLFMGVILWMANKMGIPLGKMPGDISIEKGNYSIYFPIVTSIVISILLTILINAAIYLWRK